LSLNLKSEKTTCTNRHNKPVCLNDQTQREGVFTFQGIIITDGNALWPWNQSMIICLNCACPHVHESTSAGKITCCESGPFRCSQSHGHESGIDGFDCLNLQAQTTHSSNNFVTINSFLFKIFSLAPPTNLRAAHHLIACLLFCLWLDRRHGL
jgi:hypothetical protein